MNLFSIHSKQKKGFTLIELLVVIAIIGVLSSVVLASVNTARKNARDARRKADLRTIANALELYRSANNGYPVKTGWFNCGKETTWVKSSCKAVTVDSIAKILKDGGYVGDIISDPSFPLISDANGNIGAQELTSGNRTNYLIRTTKDKYSIYARLENPSDPNNIEGEGDCLDEKNYSNKTDALPLTWTWKSYKINYCVGTK